MKNIDKIKSMTVEEMAEFLKQNEDEASDGQLWRDIDKIQSWLKSEVAE